MSDNHQDKNQPPKQVKDRKPDLKQPDLQQPEELLIDVSGLEQPEPFTEVMHRLKALNKGSYLHMLHRRIPYPLLQILNENGFDFKITEAEKTVFEAFIWKSDDWPTGDFCKKQ